MGAGTRSFTAHTLYTELTGRAQVRRGGAELRATLGALREAGPSDRSGHRGRGLYDTALAGGTGRSRRRRRSLRGAESVRADFSRNRVARISKSRACALQRWPAARPAREGDLASGKASAARAPATMSGTLAKIAEIEAEVKGAVGAPLPARASLLQRYRSSGVPSAASGPGFRPGATNSLRSLSLSLHCLSPLPMQPPFLSSCGLGLSACISQLPLCSASHFRHPALGQYSLRFSAHVFT